MVPREKPSWEKGEIYIYIFQTKFATHIINDICGLTLRRDLSRELREAPILGGPAGGRAGSPSVLTKEQDFGNSRPRPSPRTTPWAVGH